MSKLYVNIVHRVDVGERAFEALRFQLDEANRLGLKTTILYSHPALLEPALVAYGLDQRARYGHALGIHTHCMICEDILEVAENRDPALYLHTQASKQRILTRMFQRFEERFGFRTEEIGGYVFDAGMLDHIRRTQPQVRAAITNCFEEGVKMFEGNNHSWYLFSDGGPWGPYYPSRANALLPAMTPADECGIVGLPHLSRDMILALTSRDDYFSSHPANVMRAKANNGPRSLYLDRFIDQWLQQADYNGYSYYNLFVSSAWLSPDMIYVDNYRHARAIYTASLERLAGLKREGRAEVVTMADFADWFRAHVPVGQPEVNHWRDILCGTKREMFWYVDPWMRVAVDLNIGGTIGDLRVYTGRLDADLGPEGRGLANGNYPYVISREHRSHPSHGLTVSCRGARASIGDRRTIGRVSRDANGRHVLTIDPVRLKLGEMQVVVGSTLIFEGNGRMRFTRSLVDCSDAQAVVEFSEVHKGCWGTIPYPEDMRGIVLTARNAVTEEQLTYSYGSRRLELLNPTVLTAQIPQIRAGISLECSEADRGAVEELHVFEPYYVLTATKRLCKGESFSTWMTCH